MPMRASKKKVRQRSAQDWDNSLSTSFQRLDTEKSSFTDEQISEITQQRECKIARKVKDENPKTENTILRALGSLSENLLNDDVNNMNVVTTLRGEDSGQDYLASYGLDSNQENVISQSVFDDSQLKIQDICYGNQEWEAKFRWTWSIRLKHVLLWVSSLTRVQKCLNCSKILFHVVIEPGWKATDYSEHGNSSMVAHSI